MLSSLRLVAVTDIMPVPDGITLFPSEIKIVEAVAPTPLVTAAFTPCDSMVIVAVFDLSSPPTRSDTLATAELAYTPLLLLYSKVALLLSKSIEATTAASFPMTFTGTSRRASWVNTLPATLP